MIAPRWRKPLNDARQSRGRLIVLCTAMLISMAAVTALLVAQGILSRELSRSFLSARPASAILHMQAVDDALIAEVRAWPGIDAAEASATVGLRIRTGSGESLPLELTVVPDFKERRIDVFRSQTGAVSPRAGAMLIERSGSALLRLGIGASAATETFAGSPHALRIAGFVHDETRPPSTQEMTIYGYITPDTMALLEPSRTLDRLKIRVNDEHASAAQIEAVARPLAAFLRSEGHPVHLVEIPPPGEHPHQWQYESVSGVLLGFAILVAFVVALLLAIVVASLLAPQSRQVAIMKAIGARSPQIAAMYLALVGIVAFAALCIGIPSGIVGGRALATWIAGILNVSLEILSFSPAVVLVCVTLGLGVPLLAALLPVVHASRTTVREALDDHGIARATQLDGATARMPVFGATTQAAIRHAFRHRRRFVLIVTLLTFGGIVFLAAGGLLETWQHLSTSADAQRRYDLHVWLREPVDRAQLHTLATMDGIELAEPMDSLPAYLDRGDAIPVTGVGRTSFGLRFLPTQTQTFRPELVAGEWIRNEDAENIVLNTVAHTSLFPETAIGETVALLINGRSTRLRLAGIVTEPLTGGGGYASAALFDRFTDTPGKSRSLRIALSPGYSPEAVLSRLETEIARAGSEVSYVSRRELQRRAEAAHVYVLIALLGSIVALIAAVAACGLIAALGTSVVQRTREIGIMRAMGARARHIHGSIFAEAAAAVAVSWVLAMLVSVPALALIVTVMRRLAFQNLAFRWSVEAALAWLVIVAAIAVAASALPARRATRLAVNEALKMN